jgi:hypothetical protein
MPELKGQHAIENDAIAWVMDWSAKWDASPKMGRADELR